MMGRMALAFCAAVVTVAVSAVAASASAVLDPLEMSVLVGGCNEFHNCVVVDMCNAQKCEVEDADCSTCDMSNARMWCEGPTVDLSCRNQHADGECGLITQDGKCRSGLCRPVASSHFTKTPCQRPWC